MKLKTDYKLGIEDGIPAGTEALIVDEYPNGNVVIEFANGALWTDITPNEVDELFEDEHLKEEV